MNRNSNNLQKFLLENDKDFEDPEKKKENLLWAKIYLIFANIFYVINTITIKLTFSYKEDFSFNAFAFWRFLTVFNLSFGKRERIRLGYSFLCKLPENKWIYWRFLFSYLALFFLVYSLEFLRLSTCTVFFLLYPVLTSLLGTSLLNETFRPKYLLGFILCFGASFLFIINERTNGLLISNFKDRENKENGLSDMEKLNYSNNSQISMGIFSSILVALCLSLINISSKKLKENLTSQYMNAFTGFYLMLISLIFGLIFDKNFLRDFIDINILLIGTGNGILIWIAYWLLSESGRYSEASEVSYLNYTEIILGIFCGVLFFREYFGLVDFIGFFIIIGTNLYLSFNSDDNNNDN